ncbi:MAG: hypothetical protein LUD57_03435 [Ruminococcus sp.]|nr:hypothetical protein [Ruminococcus sp.]
MDNIIVTAVVVLAAIAVIEAVSLFYKASRRVRKLAFAAVVPVFPNDGDLRERLEYLSEKLSCGSYYIEEIIIINYGATTEQLEICCGFCYENKNAVLTDPVSLEKILSKTFAIARKT